MRNNRSNTQDTLVNTLVAGLLRIVSCMLIVSCTASPTLPPLSTRRPPGTPGTPEPGATLPIGQPVDGTPAARSTATRAVSPTPPPPQLVVCQTEEPASLYLYGEDLAARQGILDALFDGPIDSVGYTYQAVLLQSLPSLTDRSATVRNVEVHPGDRVVDAATGAVTQLVDGVQLWQADGSRITYSGGAPAQTAQFSAVFKLKDAHWSDGEPLTADDSVFSFEMAAQEATPASKFIVERTLLYEELDQTSVRWVGLPGWWDTDYFLRFWTPLPRHAYGAIAPLEMLTDPNVTRAPLSWGPFMVSEWSAGSQLTLTRNPYYFRVNEGLPKVERVVFRFGLTAAQIISDLLAGRCDLASESVAFNTDELAALRDAQLNQELNAQFVSSLSFEHLDFGILPAEDYERAAGFTLFQNVKMRQAFAYCLDRQALANQLFGGVAEVPDTYVSAKHPLFASEAVTRYVFDPQLGDQVLTDLGWVDRNKDGVRESGRKDLRLTYSSGPPGNAFREALMGLVQAQLRENCGIDLQIELRVPEELYDPWPYGLFFGRKFDVGQFPWRSGIEPPCDLYLTSAIPSPQNPGGANNTGYSNADFDTACSAGQSALNPEQRRAQHIAAQIIFSRELPSLPLFFRVKAGAATWRVGGYQLDSTARSALWNVENLTVSR